MMHRWLLVVGLFYLMSCNSGQPDYQRLPLRGEQGFHMVVEIPAGGHIKMEYDAAAGRIQPDRIEGQVREIDFLPYPGNYGFIPQTTLSVADGGDGDALDVLLLGPRLETGTVTEVLPIGMLNMLDGGQQDPKIIAVPADPALRTVKASDFDTFLIRYDVVKRILEEWFQHYKGYGAIEFTEWQDESVARQTIQEWSK